MSKEKVTEIRYVGGEPAIDVLNETGWDRVEQGAVYATTAERAELLLGQGDNWEPAKAPVKKEANDG